MSTALTTQPATTLPAWMAGIAGALPDAIASAKTIIEAGFAPKDCKGPQAIVVAVAMGARLGLDPFTAMYGIAVVNGRPSLYGDALLAVCQNHPQWEDFKETWEGKKYDGDFTATCTVKRKGRDPFVVDFCVNDAIQAGLWKKAGPWTTTPQRMLMMRARAFALRGAFADALAGFHSREEMEDTLVDVTAGSTVRDEPKPGKVRTVKEKTPPVGTEQEADAAKVTTYAANDDQEPVVITDDDDVQEIANEFGATREITQLNASGVPVSKTVVIPPVPKVITIKDCVEQATRLFKTEDGKRLLKDHLRAWKVEKVQELGELPDEEIARYFHKLEEIVALHAKMHGGAK